MPVTDPSLGKRFKVSAYRGTRDQKIAAAISAAHNYQAAGDVNGDLFDDSAAIYTLGNGGTAGPNAYQAIAEDDVGGQIGNDASATATTAITMQANVRFEFSKDAKVDPGRTAQFQLFGIPAALSNFTFTAKAGAFPTQRAPNPLGNCKRPEWSVGKAFVDLRGHAPGVNGPGQLGKENYAFSLLGPYKSGTGPLHFKYENLYLVQNNDCSAPGWKADSSMFTPRGIVLSAAPKNGLFVDISCDSCYSGFGFMQISALYRCAILNLRSNGGTPARGEADGSDGLGGKQNYGIVGCDFIAIYGEDVNAVCTMMPNLAPNWQDNRILYLYGAGAAELFRSGQVNSHQTLTNFTCAHWYCLSGNTAAWQELKPCQTNLSRNVLDLSAPGIQEADIQDLHWNYAKDGNGNDIPFAPGANKQGTRLNDVQQVRITGSPTGGTFTLTYRGQTTTPIAYNATSSQVQTALEALSNVAVGDVSISGGPLPATALKIVFQGALIALSPSLIGFAAALTGGSSPAVHVDEISPLISKATMLADWAQHRVILGSPPPPVPGKPTLSGPASPQTEPYDLTVTGVDDQAADWHWRINGGAYSAGATASATDSHLFPALAAGTYVVEAYLSNATGNGPVSDPYQIVVNTVGGTKPGAATISMGPALQTTDSDAPFAYSAANATSYEHSIDGAAFAAAGNGSETLHSVAPGVHTYKVRGVNAAGKGAASAAFQWTVISSGLWPALSLPLIITDRAAPWAESGATQLNIPYPAYTPGDLLLLIVGWDSNGAIQTPAGFAPAAGGQRSASTLLSLAAYTRIADGTEAGMLTVTGPNTNGGDGFILPLGNVYQPQPVLTSSAADSGAGAGTAISVPAPLVPLAAAAASPLEVLVAIADTKTTATAAGWQMKGQQQQWLAGVANRQTFMCAMRPQSAAAIAATLAGASRWVAFDLVISPAHTTLLVTDPPGDVTVIGEPGDVYTVQIHAESPLGLTSVTANGQPVTLDGSGDGTYPLVMQTGVNALVVVATDTLGQDTTVQRTIILTSPTSGGGGDEPQTIIVSPDLARIGVLIRTAGIDPSNR